MGSKGTNECQYDQICTSLKVGIGGNIHGVEAMWEAKLFTENWDFLLVYGKNAFNDINFIGMLWTVRHLWPSGASFFKLLSSLVISRPLEQEWDVKFTEQ